MKRTKSFEVKNFIVHFDAIFTNQELSKCFQQFLKSEFNEEPFLFLNSVQQLSEKKEKTILIEKMLLIVEDFLIPGSNREINVSGKSKIPILEFYENYKNSSKEDWIVEQSPEIIFHPICKIVKHELFHDPWRRFLRTKPCEEMMIKYQQDSTVCSPQIIENFMYKDEYFSHPYLFQSDFKFAASLFEDNFHWELIGRSEEGKMNTFVSNLNYLPNVKAAKNIKTVKFESVLPVNFQRIIFSYSSNFGVVKSDPNVSMIKTLNFFNSEQLKEEF
jgi:hypothetical protein